MKKKRKKSEIENFKERKKNKQTEVSNIIFLQNIIFVFLQVRVLNLTRSYFELLDFLHFLLIPLILYQLSNQYQVDLKYL